MSHLAPCHGCDRHVRADEVACPFCGEGVRPSAPPALPTRRLSRAARLVFGATVAASLGLGGCTDSHGPGDDAGAAPADAGPEDAEVSVALYGAPGP